jgi:hypothetical protein
VASSKRSPDRAAAAGRSGVIGARYRAGTGRLAPAVRTTRELARSAQQGDRPDGG